MLPAKAPLRKQYNLQVNNHVVEIANIRPASRRPIIGEISWQGDVRVTHGSSLRCNSEHPCATRSNLNAGASWTQKASHRLAATLLQVGDKLSARFQTNGFRSPSARDAEEAQCQERKCAGCGRCAVASLNMERPAQDVVFRVAVAACVGKNGESRAGCVIVEMILVCN